MQETMEAETISLSSEAFPMQAYPAIGAELARLNAGAALSCGELLRVKQLRQAARRAKKNIRPDEERDIHLLPEIASGLVYDDYLIEVINQSIESEDEVADSASSELRAIRRRMVKENDAIREKLNSVIRGKDTAKYLQESIITCLLYTSRDYGLPHQFAKVIRDFPRMRIIRAHMGAMNHWEEFLELLAGKNLYIDTAVCARYMEPKYAERIMKQHGLERVLLGSDFPWDSIAHEMEWFEQMDFTSRQKDMIFSENARALLGI